jgi:nucleotide-binding universal stress UspA family protein
MPMFRKVLCATDFSEAADVAIRAADREARLHRARLVILHAAPSTFPGALMFPHEVERSLVERERLASELIDLVLERVGALTGRTADEMEIVIEDGPADVAIVKRGEELGADLTVIGSVGASGLRRLFLGGVASRVVRYAHGSVLVARPGPDSGRLLLATDFSGPSGPAAEAAADEARRRGAHLTVAHSLEVIAPDVGFREPMPLPPSVLPIASIDELRSAARQQLELALAAASVPGDVAVTVGPPGRSIVRLAEQVRAELVVVGTAGRTGIDRILLGSVAEAVVRDAPCSVLVVRPAAAARRARRRRVRGKAASPRAHQH